jgi:hypothetical protein
MVTQENMRDLFAHHQPDTPQIEHIHAIRQAAMTLAETILRHTPACDDQQAAILRARESMMLACAAVMLQQQHEG